MAAAVIAGVASAAMSGAALVNAIVHQSVNGCLRSVVINLTNDSPDMLINPQVYTYSGYCYVPPQPTVEKGNTETCSFGLTKGTACGAVGVLTYDIAKDRRTEAAKRLAIMFSVPFNYNHYENWLALGLFETTQICDHSLYSSMYYDEGSFKRGKGTGSQIRFQDGPFTLIGTMSPVTNSEIKVQLLHED